MNYVAWCDRVWEAALAFYRQTPAVARSGDVTVLDVANQLWGGQQPLAGACEDAIRGAMTDLTSHGIFTPPSPLRNDRKSYRLTGFALTFHEQCATLHRFLRGKPLDAPCLAVLRVIADLTEHEQADCVQPSATERALIQPLVSLADPALLGDCLNTLSRAHMIKLASRANAHPSSPAISMRYAGLLRLEL